MTYPEDLQGLLGAGVQVQNFGVSGTTMQSTDFAAYQNTSDFTAATEFVADAGTGAVVDVIIMLGTNDSAAFYWNASTSPAQFTKDCAALIDHFTSQGTHPVVYLATPPTAYVAGFTASESLIEDPIIPIIRQVAAEKGMPVIDVHAATAGLPNDFVDGIHPTDTGYALVASTMEKGLLAEDAYAADSGLSDASDKDAAFDDAGSAPGSARGGPGSDDDAGAGRPSNAAGGGANGSTGGRASEGASSRGGGCTLGGDARGALPWLASLAVVLARARRRRTAGVR
jgi:lysophospholipase L1-like esterase